MAVLVQQLVPADAAGVAFSADAVNGRRDETMASFRERFGLTLHAS
jgi:phosphoenolpyruvate synthase/pyruvate phosphate dikinase